MRPFIQLSLSESPDKTRGRLIWSCDTLTFIYLVIKFIREKCWVMQSVSQQQSRRTGLYRLVTGQDWRSVDAVSVPHAVTVLCAGEQVIRWAVQQIRQSQCHIMFTVQLCGPQIRAQNHLLLQMNTESTEPFLQFDLWYKTEEEEVLQGFWEENVLKQQTY